MGLLEICWASGFRAVRFQGLGLGAFERPKPKPEFSAAAGGPGGTEGKISVHELRTVIRSGS